MCAGHVPRVKSESKGELKQRISLALFFGFAGVLIATPVACQTDSLSSYIANNVSCYEGRFSVLELQFQHFTCE